MENLTRGTLFVAFFAVAIIVLFPCLATTQDAKTVMVNVDNFVRAETASQIDRALMGVGNKVNTWGHLRTPTPLDKQTFLYPARSPGKAKESNWLPAPEGPFSVVLRLYWRKIEAIEGE